MKYLALITAVCSLSSLACDPEQNCEDDQAEPELTNITPVPLAPVSADFELSGRVETTRRITALRVNGAPVEGLSDNYGSWKYLLTIAELRKQAYSDGDAGGSTGDEGEGGGLSEAIGHAQIEIIAEDVCKTPVPLRTLRIPVARDPAAEPVGALRVTPTLPDWPGMTAADTACYAPANGSQLVGFRVESNSPADFGLLIALKSTRGLLIPGGATALALRDDPTHPGVDVALQIADQLEGAVTVTATSGTTVSLATITVAGPPAFSGASGPIPAGGNALVNVSTGGILRSCRADTTTDGATATLNGESLLDDGQAFAAGDCGQLKGIIVGFAGDDPPFSTIRLTCTDVFGQSASHLLSVAP